MEENTDHAEPDFNFIAIFNYYKRYFRADLSDYEKEKLKLILPIVPLPILSNLCDAAAEIFGAEPMLLHLDFATVIIGDLHGHLLDLFRTIGKLGFPPTRSYLFLGDLVDRGEFSTETTIVILVMKVIWPKNVFVIRGNHEFLEMAQHGGFSAELMALYNNQMAEDCFMRAFSYIPIAALIGKSVLCVHGGLGPSVKTLDQLAEIPRPLTDYNDELVQSLLWSDPAQFVPDFQPSSRGIGYFFGPDALANFLDSNGLQFLIRGHECVEKGIEMQLNRRMFTVFGASNYCGLSPNKAGVLLVHPDASREACFFTAMAYLKRTSATFLTSETEDVFKVRRFGVPGDHSSKSRQRLPALEPCHKPLDDKKPTETHSSRPAPRVQTEFRMKMVKKFPSMGPPRKEVRKIVAPRR